LSLVLVGSERMPSLFHSCLVWTPSWIIRVASPSTSASSSWFIYLLMLYPQVIHSFFSFVSLLFSSLDFGAVFIVVFNSIVKAQPPCWLNSVLFTFANVTVFITIILFINLPHLSKQYFTSPLFSNT
jgi:hypothetical protein